MQALQKNTIAAQLSAASLALNNTLGDAEIQAFVTSYGYSADMLQEGQALYTAAADAVSKQNVSLKAQRQATIEAHTAEQSARANYAAFVKVARAVYRRDKGKRTMLGVTGMVPADTVKFIAAATELFDTAMNIPAISTTLARFGYGMEQLTLERAAITALTQAGQAQAAAKGTAQQATRDQTEALAALRDWLGQYIQIAKVALRDKPQLLEKLGCLARSGRTAAQRQAPQKAAATRAAKKLHPRAAKKPEGVTQTAGATAGKDEAKPILEELGVPMQVEVPLEV